MGMTFLGSMILAAACGPLAAVDPAAYGFDPAAAPATNAAALQKALDGGNRKVVVSKPGVYGMDRTVFIDSHTELSFAKGVVLQKRAKYANVLVNRGAYNYGHDEDITVRGLEISVNGFQMVPPFNSPARNLRGQLAFYSIKDVKVYDFRCVDLGNWQYCVHFVDFDGVLIDGFEIRGRKDGVHFNCGRNFTVRNGVICTCDDGIAINAGDWPDCAPVIGSIENGLVEKIHMLPTEIMDKAGRQRGELGLVIAGVWTDWHPGMRLQRNDVVRSGNNVYAVAPMPFNTNETVSLTRPEHTKGVWKSPEGINFLFLQSNGVCRADVKNVKFRDILCDHPNSLRASWEVGSPWARLVHPEIPPEDYPKIDITLERMRTTVTNRSLLRCSAAATVKIVDCRSNGPLLGASGPRQLDGSVFPGLKRKVTITDCVFDGEKRTDVDCVSYSETELVLENNRQSRDVVISTGGKASVTVSGDTKYVKK